jgi:60 kDa SS-A/Ro ribonucleoprotein
MNYTKHLTETPQTSPIPGRASEMKQNNAGGYTFTVTPEKQFERFLLLGSENGSFYVDEAKLTRENAENAINFIQKAGKVAVERIVAISQGGLAQKNDAAIFALALVTAFGNQEAKQAAYAAIPKVCRTGTHLFTFCQNVQDLRGWSRGLRNGVASFYTAKTEDQLALQLVKYRQRNGWTHRDVLRLAHPAEKDLRKNLLLRKAVGKEVTYPAGVDKNPLYAAYEEVQTLGTTAKEVSRAVSLIREYRLPWEALPTELLNHVSVWDALIQEMPITATIRNLGKVTSLGLLKPMSQASKLVTSRLTDRGNLKKGRVHPLSLLIALKTYESGHGFRGSLKWDPVEQITQALEDAFYLAFETVEPTGKNTLLALDVSGSMDSSTISNSNISAREATAAIAMVTARTEPNHYIFGFSNRFIPLKITAKQSLPQVLKTIDNLPFESTDCSLPMVYAKREGLEVDTFAVYTDNETYAGAIQPSQALAQYRSSSGRAARSVVVATSVSSFTIADPKDAGMLDVAGLTGETPHLIAEFSRGNI